MLVPLALVVIVGASPSTRPHHRSAAVWCKRAGVPPVRIPRSSVAQPHGVCPRRSRALSMFGLLSARPRGVASPRVSRADAAVFVLQAPPLPKTTATIPPHENTSTSGIKSTTTTQASGLMRTASRITGSSLKAQSGSARGTPTARSVSWPAPESLPSASRGFTTGPTSGHKRIQQ